MPGRDDTELDPSFDDTVVEASGPDVASGMPAMRPGTLVAGRFVADRLLGEGTFGQVFAATDRQTGERVALKLLRPELAERGSSLVRLKRRELEVLKRVHASAPARNVVRVVVDDLLEHAGCAVLVLELVEGPTLGDVLAKERVLDEAEARGFAAGLARGLAAIHAADGVHRDLKPENIRLRGDIEPVILDLGIARALWQTNTLTGTGQTPMTPLYAAPEQLSGQVVGPPGDIYSLGLIFFEMLVGSVPLTGRTFPEILSARISKTAPDPRSSGRALRDDTASWIQRCLERDPAARPTATELADALGGRAPESRPRVSDGAAFASTVDPTARTAPSMPGTDPRAFAPTEAGPRAPEAPQRAKAIAVGAVAAAVLAAVAWLGFRGGATTAAATSEPSAASAAGSAIATSDAAPAAADTPGVFFLATPALDGASLAGRRVWFAGDVARIGHGSCEVSVRTLRHAARASSLGAPRWAFTSPHLHELRRQGGAPDQAQTLRVAESEGDVVDATPRDASCKGAYVARVWLGPASFQMADGSPTFGARDAYAVEIRGGRAQDGLRVSVPHGVRARIDPVTIRVRSSSETRGALLVLRADDTIDVLFPLSKGAALARWNDGAAWTYPPAGLTLNAALPVGQSTTTEIVLAVASSSEASVVRALTAARGGGAALDRELESDVDLQIAWSTYEILPTKSPAPPSAKDGTP